MSLFGGSGKKRRRIESGSDGEAEALPLAVAAPLLTYTTSALTRCFMHDASTASQGKFMDATRFHVVLPCLLGLLDYAEMPHVGGAAAAVSGSDGKLLDLVEPATEWLIGGAFKDGYRSFCEQLLLPAISKLADAAGKDALWKPLNHQVMRKGIVWGGLCPCM